jgi:hypothetical protein
MQRFSSCPAIAGRKAATPCSDLSCSVRCGRPDRGNRHRLARRRTADGRRCRGQCGPLDLRRRVCRDDRALRWQSRYVGAAENPGRDPMRPRGVALPRMLAFRIKKRKRRIAAACVGDRGGIDGYGGLGLPHRRFRADREIGDGAVKSETIEAGNRIHLCENFNAERESEDRHSYERNRRSSVVWPDAVLSRQLRITPHGDARDKPARPLARGQGKGSTLL